jgi:hypothetical protein
MNVGSNNNNNTHTSGVSSPHITHMITYGKKNAYKYKRERERDCRERGLWSKPIGILQKQNTR